MTKPKILVQLDSDRQASVFDAVVALDAGVDQLLRHHSVELSEVRDLVYGAIFTRGPDDLRHTAIFVGGSDVGVGEAMLAQVIKSFVGPMSVSVMLDSNGANTTAAAAVLAAAQHVPLGGARALVLAGTGPVGSRVVRLLAGEGAHVIVASRSRDRAEAVCRSVQARLHDAQVTACEAVTAAGLNETLEGVEVLIAAGPPGIELLNAEALRRAAQAKVAIDLSAVPPLGLGGIKVTDRGTERAGLIAYGAIGVGGTKMKIHKAAIRQLFEANDQVLDAEEIYQLGKRISS